MSPDTAKRIELPAIDDLTLDEIELVTDVTGLDFFELADVGERDARNLKVLRALVSVAVQREHPAWDADKVRKHVGQMRMLPLLEQIAGTGEGNGDAEIPPARRRSRSAAASGTSTTTTAPADQD